MKTKFRYELERLEASFEQPRFVSISESERSEINSRMKRLLKPQPTTWQRFMKWCRGLSARTIIVHES